MAFKNVMFLDFDGVINIPIWSGEFDNETPECRYSYPEDGKANHYQAVQWVSEFCIKHDFVIVVSSTWRSYGYEACKYWLKNSGLREAAQVVGVTPRIYDKQRGDEIGKWLSLNPGVEKYIIIDDDSDMTVHQDHLVLCNTYIGYMYPQFAKSEKMLLDGVLDVK